MDVAEEKLRFIELAVNTRRRLANNYSLNNKTINEITVHGVLSRLREEKCIYDPKKMSQF